ncbi:hypothetical protein HC931_07680 [Candidatus Gracilibacteria bacterium]|nr:hypothetical protein [Candidatus Gracilibacteria bacterium]NJM89157.1 hypothetical protein [Hydrococcus sp. RU_2_2]NJP20980.1 hypothetical protein [Hydrococcus sp. CRU_1_1]
MGKEAKKLTQTSIRFFKRNFDFILKFGERADRFKTSCCSFSGDEQGTIDFNSWLALEGNPGHVTKAALKIYEFYNSLPRVWQLFMTTYVENWSFNALTILTELNLKVLDVFFWGAELLRKQRKHRKKKETKEELTLLVNASKGIRKVYNSQPLEIADWVYIYSVTRVERSRFDSVRSLAIEIAKTSNREVYLEDAIAALNEFGYNTSAIDTVKEKAPPTEKKLYTQSDRDRAVEEATLTLKQELAQKDAELQILKEQNEALKEKEVEIAEKEKQIEWLKKLLEDAQKSMTSQTPSTSNSLKIEDLSPIVAPPDSLFHPTKEPLEIGKPSLEIAIAAREITNPLAHTGKCYEMDDWRKRKNDSHPLSKGFGNTRSLSTSATVKGFGRR